MAALPVSNHERMAGRAIGAAPPTMLLAIWAHSTSTNARCRSDVRPSPAGGPLATSTCCSSTTRPLDPAGAHAPQAAPLSPRVSAGWVATVAHATGIPAVALRAYADASLTIGVEQPGCRLGWSTLAAIGGIESGHGTHGGSVLREDGTTTDPILGPALDGRAGFAAIRATPESTAWHGDATWDHAVGPMQMLPSTWSRWRADGDGDGVDDPNDIDDAALGAARYLCASGADLTGATGWHDAVFSYNHSEQYVADVLGAANRYAAGSLAG